MRIIAGAPVKGADFRYRARDLALTISSLTDGTSLLVKGWRRIGKSSLLLETHRQLALSDTITPIYLDVQETASISEFFAAFLKAMPANKLQQLQKLLAGARQLPGQVMNAIQRRIRSAGVGAGGVEGNVEFERDIRDYWEPLKDSVEVLAKTQLGAGARLVLLLDELPFFLENIYRRTENIDDIRLVLATLRAWRNAGLTMAIAGSVSIEAFLEDLGIEGLVINDLTRLELQPLTRDEAEELVVDLAGIASLAAWDAESTSQLLDELPDHYPFFIQSAMNFLRADGRTTPEAIEDVFENQIHPHIFASFYQQFDERLERRFTAEQRPAALGVLNAMAGQANGKLTNAEIDAVCNAFGQDPLTIKRRLELAEFIRTDVKASGYRLVQNLLRHWRQARGGL